MLVVLATGLLVAPSPASAAAIAVGANGCTLADAIVAANTDTATGGCAAGSGADTIVLEAGATYSLTAPTNEEFWAGSNGLPVVTTTITINGNGAIIERAAGASDFRLIAQTGGDLILQDLTIRGGRAMVTGAGAFGGCVHSSGGALTVERVTMTDCQALWNGGALEVIGERLLTIRDSTFYGNVVVPGSVVDAVYGVQATIVNSTFSENTADSSIASAAEGTNVDVVNVAIAEDNVNPLHTQTGGTLTYRNSILQPQTIADFPPEAGVNLGNNLIGDNLQLGPLQDNGGPTMTVLPLPGSPAIDGADGANCPATDQRGVQRPQGVGCDIGAVEVTAAPSLMLPGDMTRDATSPDGAVALFTATATNYGGDSITAICDPASGSTFPVGTTTVTCMATDDLNQTTTGTFTITVIGAGGQLDELATMIDHLPISGSASTANSIRRTMLSMVSLARGFEASGADGASCLMLSRLELEVRSQVSKRRITTRDAQTLWTKIDEVQAAIGCGGAPN